MAAKWMGFFPAEACLDEDDERVAAEDAAAESRECGGEGEPLTFENCLKAPEDPTTICCCC